jgi:ATP-dependent DNA helicase RecG
VILSLIEDVEKDVEKEKTLSKNEQIILIEIKKDAKISAAKLSVILGINTRNTQKTLDRLKTKGLIERIGADKGGYWNIKN